MFFKIGALKSFAIFTGRRLCWSLFSIKLQVLSPATLLKRDSNVSVLCEYCEKQHHFYSAPPVAGLCFKLLTKNE